MHDKIVNYINITKKMSTLIYSSIVAGMLVRLNYVYVMSLLLVLSISFIVIIINIYKMLEVKK